MSVEYTNGTLGATLKINPVEGDDEATYKCEITYLEVIENCDVVQVVKLRTLSKYYLKCKRPIFSCSIYRMF